MIKLILSFSLIYQFFELLRNIFEYIKESRSVGKVLHSEDFRNVLRRYLYVDFDEDWLGRVYGVINPLIDIDGKVNFNNQIIEIDGKNTNNNEYVKSFLYKQLSLMNELFKLEGLYNYVTMSIEHVGPSNGDNYLIVFDTVAIKSWSDGGNSMFFSTLIFWVYNLFNNCKYYILGNSIKIFRNIMEKEEIAKQLDDFKQSLKGKSLDELKKIEEEIVAECDKVNDEVGATEYDVPKENYKVVATEIRNFLNKQTVQWQFTLAMVTMYDFWDPKNRPDKILHPVLDQTLRTLGGLSFTGYDEWAAVIAINKYFEPLTNAFTENTQKVYDAASKHNIVMDEMGLNTPINQE